MRRLAGTFLFSLVVACSSGRPDAGTTTAAPTTKASSSAAPVVPAASASTAASASASASVAAKTDEPPAHPDPTFDEIVNVLFADRDRAGVAPITGTTCPASTPAEARIRCVIDERYKGDPKAASLAHELYVKWRIVAGVEVAHTMDGGYRGMIKLVPEVPINAERKHIEWIVQAMRDFDQFFGELDSHAAEGATKPSMSKKRYRFKPITLRFTRSVAARTPSAYAHDWTVVWNVAGSLHRSADDVRETLFHEMFHLNDYAASHLLAGKEAWSFDALGSIFDVPVKKCGTSIQCLTPYTPNETIVKGGTYYSFQPGNGVREYAAELALRYYREQRAAMRSLSPKVKPFKCGPPENMKSWNLMRDEYFGGVDVVPSC